MAMQEPMKIGGSYQIFREYSCTIWQSGSNVAPCQDFGIPMNWIWRAETETAGAFIVLFGVAGYGQTDPEFMALGVLTLIRTAHSFSFGICLVTGGEGNQSLHRVTPLWQFNIAIETGQLGVDLPSGNQTWQWKIHYL